MGIKKGVRMENLEVALNGEYWTVIILYVWWCGDLGESEDLLCGTGFLGSPDGCGGPEEAVISDVRTSVWSVLRLSKSFCLREIM